MDELTRYSLALGLKKKRLRELEEISGGPDPDHPLQGYCLRRIAWLEKQIEELKKQA